MVLPLCGIEQLVLDLSFGGANWLFNSCQVYKVECPFPTGSHGLSVTLFPRCLFFSALPDCPCALREPSASSAQLSSPPCFSLLTVCSQNSTTPPFYQGLHQTHRCGKKAQCLLRGKFRQAGIF